LIAFYYALLVFRTRRPPPRSQRDRLEIQEPRYSASFHFNDFDMHLTWMWRRLQNDHRGGLAGSKSSKCVAIPRKRPGLWPFFARRWSALQAACQRLFGHLNAPCSRPLSHFISF